VPNNLFRIRANSKDALLFQVTFKGSLHLTKDLFDFFQANKGLEKFLQRKISFENFPYTKIFSFKFARL